MNDLREPLRFIPRATASGAPARVTLVGAGPGDPDLLTVRAWRAITQARTVLVDALVSDEILALLPREAERVDVGKRSGNHTLPQEQIIALMIRLARSGKPVLRLKGGDPTVFGRGGEEAQALAAAGVPFELVPGITAAQGAAALAGMPLTHRDHAQAVVFATGHLRNDGGQRRVDLDWDLLARAHQTVVIYMGVSALPEICAGLMRHGLPGSMPAAVVEDIARPGMRRVTGTLDNLPQRATAAAVRSPALIVVGEVVALSEVLVPVLGAAVPEVRRA